MNHTKMSCTANDQIIAGACGLACANCGACKCGKCKEPEWSNAPFEEKYRALRKALEFKVDLKINVKSGFMDKTVEEWTLLLLEDEHLNNVPLYLWDSQAVRVFDSVIRNPLRSGWSLSTSELVCMFKQAVKDMVQEANLYVLTRDGQRIMCGTEDQCFKYLSNAHPGYSVDHAFRFEGFKIEKGLKNSQKD